MTFFKLTQPFVCRGVFQDWLQSTQWAKGKQHEKKQDGGASSYFLVKSGGKTTKGRADRQIKEKISTKEEILAQLRRQNNV